jgi:hypothetical protein
MMKTTAPTEPRDCGSRRWLGIRPSTARRQLAVVALGLLVSGCGKGPPAVSERDYPTALVGQWRGTVGNFKEVMTLHGDGTFNCQLAPAGFIATMIYPVPAGSVSGTWRVAGKIISLAVTSAHNERLENGLASSTIVAFNGNQLVLQAQGTTATFERTGD